MGNNAVRRICLDGILISLFLVFGLIRIRLGFLEIGLGTLVITIAAIALGPIDAILIALLGEFVNQILFSGYGLTPTTPLWIAPVVIRAAILSLIAWLYRRKGDALPNHKVIYFLAIMGTALIISGIDTGILYLDGIIMGYPVSYTVAQTFIRFGASQITAVLVGLLVLPLYKAVLFLLPKDERRGEKTQKE